MKNVIIAIVVVLVLSILVGVIVQSKLRQFSLQIGKTEKMETTDYIEVIYGGVDEFIRVGQKVTLLSHPKFKGLIGKPMTIIAVDKPFVAIRWLSILGDEITDNVDLRECELMPITDNYFLAGRAKLHEFLPEWVDEEGNEYYDFIIGYATSGVYDVNSLEDVGK